MAPVIGTQRAQPQERRAYKRYPVGLNLRYALFRDSAILHEGSGKTVDFSAEGVFFHADRTLPEGFDVELRVDWPAIVNGTSLLRVNLSGRIVRSTETGSAVKIEHTQFLASDAAATSLGALPREN